MHGSQICSIASKTEMGIHLISIVKCFSNSESCVVRTHKYFFKYKPKGQRRLKLVKKQKNNNNKQKPITFCLIKKNNTWLVF